MAAGFKRSAYWSWEHMGEENDKLRERLSKSEFPRSSAYDPQWLLDNTMGPHVLWLTEWLCAGIPLRPGMRVLDLGCGRALSSIFLAEEFGVTVWAADLWIKPTENWKRTCLRHLRHYMELLFAKHASKERSDAISDDHQPR